MFNSSIALSSPAVTVHILAILLPTAAFRVGWMRVRFSLRTLLIGVTVAAVVLGLVIWAAK